MFANTTRNKLPVQTFGRVLYVEPNDVSGAINGVPLTPDYTDMCISFNLVCEVKSRIQNDIPTGETRVKSDNKNTRSKAAIYQIFGVTGDGDTKSWVSFLQGEAYKNTNSLTTYYVDINYDDYLKNNIVEGLGVENITISHESYYTPNVSIKFVDHRGASLFGREEATHYNDKLTIDNIFGAFFTAPYPEYYLQVKGFYGRPITYRLCCTSFKGRMNSDTGNFEAIATFVGYSYSLLTDIPFEYLVAAPYCKYVGEDYWKAHRGTTEWLMEGNIAGDEVPTIFELLQRINAAFTNEELLQVISNEEKEETEKSISEKRTLESLQAGYENYIGFLKSRCSNNISDSDKYDFTQTEGDGEIVKPYETENEQLLLMKSENSDSNWGTIETMWNGLIDVIGKYNVAYEEDSITEDILPKELPFRNMVFTDYFFINDENNVRINNIEELTVESIKKTKINGIEPSEIMARKILNSIRDIDTAKSLKKYVYLVDLGLLSNVLKNRIRELTTIVTENNRKTERNYLHLALENLGIVPYMGNIFKLIMCHIETFIEMMKQCFININRAKEVGQRHPTYLGINIKNTDFITNDRNDIFIPPWPAVNKKDTGDTEYGELEKNSTFGWVGDFSNYFEEAKLVRALYLACKRTAADPIKTDDDEKVEFLYAPILPNDLNNDKNPFERGEKNLSSLGGMLGIRAAQIFGIGEEAKISDDVAKLLGKVDALNYYRFVGDKTTLNEEIIEKCDDIENVLYDVMLCKPSADKYCKETDDITGVSSHDFEFTSDLYDDIPKRQPIYSEITVDNNKVLNYTYMPNSKGYGIVPSNTRYKTEFENDYIGTTDDNSHHYIKVDYLTDKYFMHSCTSKQLFEDYSEPDKVAGYRNTEMYKIVTGTQHVNKIFERYDQMRGGTIKVLDRSFNIDLKPVLDRYWYVDKSVKYNFYKESTYFLTKPYKDWGIEESWLLGDKFDVMSDISATFRILYTSPKPVYVTEDTNIDEGIVPLINCAINNERYSLFGVDFYYMQNQIEDADTKNRVKALLFLHTLFYNRKATMKWEDANIKHSCISRIPFGLAALYGACLWRHKYIKDHDEDPVRYGDNGEEAKYKSAYNGNVEYSLFGYTSTKKWVLRPLMANGSLQYPYRMIGNAKDGEAIFTYEPDPMVVNELISVFETFIKNQWVTICDLELRKSDGTEFSNGKAFRDIVKSIVDYRVTAIKPYEKDSVDFKKAWSESAKHAASQFASFTKNYCFIGYNITELDTDFIIIWLNPANTAMQNALRSVYLDECVELRSMCNAMSDVTAPKKRQYTDIVVNIDNIKSYISGFVEQIKDVVDNPNNDVGVVGADLGVIEDTPEFNRETAIPIYMYLKMLWDKWLVSIKLDNHEFMVKNFNDNFIFIDSFYRNIAHRFMINCQILLDCYQNNMASNLDISVFKFLSDLTTKHNSMFIMVPDFIINWSYQQDTEVRTSLETAFVPMSYTSMNNLRVNNKFVVMYIPKLSETPSEMNNFRSDGFNIWSYNDPMIENGDSTVRTKNCSLPHILDNVNNVMLEEVWQDIDYSKYSYYVPSFGVTYGRQNNHIFKDINLSMDAPTTTSVMINTLSHVARMGANNTHRVAFIGQDIYPVFSNYAYTCEFEMMGCAQIQPLMYFQLMNVPMWRGTYMIYSVTHNIIPGNMVTRVKAMKLSNRGVPYSNAWFTKNTNFDENALRRQQCLEQIADGINVNVGTITPNNNNNNNSGDDIIIKGNHSGDTPVLCGDSWAHGMMSHFKGDGIAVGSSRIADGTKYKNARQQIIDYLKKHPNPKFILIYSGRNHLHKSVSYFVGEYSKFVEACNGKTVYMIQEQWDCHHAVCNSDPNSRSFIADLNSAMQQTCNKYTNAHFVNLNSNGFYTVNGSTNYMRCCKNNGCNCKGSGEKDASFHLTDNGYKQMLKTVLTVIGETTYLK